MFMVIHSDAFREFQTRGPAVANENVTVRSCSARGLIGK